MSASYFDNLNSVRVTVVSAAGQCPLGYKVGDSWLIEGGKTPNGMCLNVFHTIYQYLTVLRFGGNYPREGEPGVTLLGCPDGKERLVYELRAVKKD